jgi:cell division protein FtsI/penicillin-binding protein 2
MPKDYKKLSNINSNANKWSNPLSLFNKNKSKQPNVTRNKLENNNPSSFWQYFLVGFESLKPIFQKVSPILFFWLVPLKPFADKLNSLINSWLKKRDNVVYLICGSLVLVMILNLINLQVLGNGQLFTSGGRSNQPLIYEVINAKRGNIYMQDLAQNRNDIPLTANQVRYNITFDPSTLKAQKYNDLQQVAELVSARTNISLSEVIQKFETEINKPKPNRYAILQKESKEEQKLAVETLKQDKDMEKQYGFSLWLGVEEANARIYPEAKTLAQTVGYTPRYNMDYVEASKRTGCNQMVIQNQLRGTESSAGYQVGDRGIEEKYCSILGGLNGRKISNQDLTNTDKLKQNTVIDGANIHLTIDRNIQKKAEQVLEEAVKTNTNSNGGPKDGCVLVAEASTGKILALASYPSFDPNYYPEYFQSNPNSFRNSCTSNDYEVGSVIKPLTVGVGLQVGQSPALDSRYNGVSPNYRFEDYDENGKPYKDGDGTIYFKNASSRSWKSYGKIGLKEILRDSINTGIADVVDRIGNKNLRQFFLDKLEFGANKGLTNLPGDTGGNVNSFYDDKDCGYCFAAKGVGQGFSIPPLQLVKAYTSLANSGQMINPVLVEKVKCASIQYECLPDNLKPESSANQIFTKNVADKVVDYMVATADEGFLGSGPGKATVMGHKMAIKSGTAQVSRPIISENGKAIACDQNCNTKRGIYDHTFIGFNTTQNNRYIVLIKLAEPKPGVVNNFATDTLSPYFAEMMKYTLEYLNVPKDR